MATLFKNVSNYKRFLISVEEQRANNNIVETVYDTLADFGLVAKSTPYPLLPKMKEPYKNDWKDEDGVEAYVEETHFEPIEFEVKFYVKAINGIGLDPTGDAANTVRTAILNFFEKIRVGYFSVYDEYTHLGRKKVRYVSYTEESFKARNGWARCIFSVKFAVDNPTDITSLYK